MTVDAPYLIATSTMIVALTPRITRWCALYPDIHSHTVPIRVAKLTYPATMVYSATPSWMGHMSAYLLTDLTALQAINLATPFPEPSRLAIQPLPIALQLGVAQLWPGVEYISSSKSYDQHSILKVLRLHWQTELEWSILACRCSSLLYSKRRVNLDTARATF